MILGKFMIQAQAVMGNEISKTEIIEVTDDNDAGGGVNDAANDRDNDRDRYKSINRSLD